MAETIKEILADPEKLTSVARNAFDSVDTNK